MSQTFKLFRLQQIDNQLDQMRARLQDIAVALQDDAFLTSAQEAAQRANEEMKEVRKALTRAEDELHNLRMKIEQTESTLYGGKVRNPKELQDLQNEAIALKRYRSTLEDRLLEEMLLEEEAAAEFKQTSTRLEIEQARYSSIQYALHEEQVKINKDIVISEEERRVTANSIPPEDLNLYTQLRNTRRGIAVARVTNKACSACGTTLNAALLDAAHSPNQLTRCDNCGRILYVV